MGGPIKIGNVTIDTIGQLKVGNTNVEAAYVGSEQVFPAGTTTTTTTTTSTTTTTTTAAPTSASLFVNNTDSLDIPITDITVNGVTVTFVSGTDFTINAGNNGNFETDQIGTFDIIVYYGGHTAGQNITITDSANNVFCCNLNGSAGSCTFVDAIVNTSQTVQIVASDGACS